MRLSEFRTAIAEEFGDAYGQVVTRDLVLVDLGDHTAEHALRSGIPPREVWLAVCRAADVPPQRRHGAGLPAQPGS
ncbi:DUF3046 domain-containing protein [Herbiconiux sp. CPCC 203407]|uniref:DUF3046 domain-containing protein n=1 Tax=Herbiconiux oxytropis TaxID=2970915 RepID=A0AA41X9V0_9MICO|nr:DUF3046 domain-containing protein [Herbiconiux oxytropis]MCS5720829.1 DUF3046 domain-containing protein [Herbiconiux oxytropis]MCS5724306.1 DUF3046 domain-containing protein [Herbiconiux oxytropis]